jgi:ABC-2 type transport system permease protein
LVKFGFTFLKELRLLGRDRSGLLLLFAMPAVLVVVITLVQDNVFKDQGGTRLEGVVVDRDGGQVARDLIHRLEQVPMLSLTRAADGVPEGVDALRQTVQAGGYRFGVVIPAGLSASVQGRVDEEFQRIFSGQNGAEAPADEVPPEVTLYLDPTMTGGYRSAVAGALEQALTAVQLQLRMSALEQGLNRRIAPLDASFVRITEKRSGRGVPTAVQQNVPAWALFGMFFIAVPLAGGLIRERRQGIAARLTTMPVSRLTLLAGKLCAYACVCLVQFVLIVLVGKWLLPRLGTAALDMGDAHGAVALVVLCSALAATGFGVMLGTLARTQEQATTLGPIAVVIAAALGGLMVPVFAMPAGMQALSRISPLAWGHDAFMELFVRGGDASAVTGQVTSLLLFFAATLLVAMTATHRRWRRI